MENNSNVSQLMNGQTICSCHTIDYYLVIKKRNGVQIHAITCMNLENRPSGKKRPVRKEHLLYDSIYMKCPKYQTHRD